MRLVLATTNNDIVDLFNRNPEYEVLGNLTDKRTFLRDFGGFADSADILLAVEGFDEGEPTTAILKELKEKYPELRIVYVCGELNLTESSLSDLKDLINEGVYDIISGEKIGTQTILDILDNPRSFEDVSNILDMEMEQTEAYKNISIVSSLKPGTGKTFLATNLAVAIAKYGKDKRLSNGEQKRPRVAIVDGDLMNLSVATMLNVDNWDTNMLTALKAIGKKVNSDGQYSMDENELDELKRFVRKCMVRYRDVDNLYCMVAPDISIQELAKIYPSHFYFMIEMLVNAFDVIIVDTNSALDHTTTGALYDLAGRIYLLIDNDYNNIQNNLRYLPELKNYEEKVHFIINKDLTDDMEIQCLEDLEYDTHKIGDLFIEHRIPLVNEVVLKAIDYNSELVATSLRKEVEVARKRVFDIANEIWPINYTKILEEVE